MTIRTISQTVNPTGMRVTGFETEPLVYLPTIEAYIAQMSSLPTFEQANALRSFFAAIDAAGIYDRFVNGALFLPGLGTKQAGLLNAMDGGVTSLVETGGTLTHTPGKGITGDGSHRLLSSVTIASYTAFTQNDASMFVVTMDKVASDDRVIAMDDGGHSITTRSSNTFLIYPGSGTLKTTTSLNGTGFYGWSRTGSTAAEVYARGRPVLSDTSNSVDPGSTNKLAVLGGGGSRSTNTVFACGIGASLSDQQVADLSDALLDLANDFFDITGNGYYGPTWDDPFNAR